MDTPLAERMRPRTLDEYVGQHHLVGEGGVIRRMIEGKRISSFILWGPPGVGKTTLAKIIANRLEVPFYTLSAVTSGVKDVRDVIDRAKKNTLFTSGSGNLKTTAYEIFGKDFSDGLIEADYSFESVQISGLISKPTKSRPNRNMQFIRPA